MGKNQNSELWGQRTTLDDWSCVFWVNISAYLFFAHFRIGQVRRVALCVYKEKWLFGKRRGRSMPQSLQINDDDDMTYGAWARASGWITRHNLLRIFYLQEQESILALLCSQLCLFEQSENQLKSKYLSDLCRRISWKCWLLIMVSNLQGNNILPVSAFLKLVPFCSSFSCKYRHGELSTNPPGNSTVTCQSPWDNKTNHWITNRRSKDNWESPWWKQRQPKSTTTMNSCG